MLSVSFEANASNGANSQGCLFKAYFMAKVSCYCMLVAYRSLARKAIHRKWRTIGIVKGGNVSHVKNKHKFFLYGSAFIFGCCVSDEKIFDRERLAF